MSRGRPSKPTALKALQGHAGHRAKADRQGKEPAPPAGTPEPPAHLDNRAKKKWYERVGIMMKVAGWLTLFDSDVLAAYCSAYSRWQETEELLPGLRREQKDRRTTAKERGKLVNEINNLVGQQRQALREMRQFGNEIGWSSASRTRIRINDGQLPLAGLGDAAGPAPDKPETEFEKTQRLASS